VLQLSGNWRDELNRARFADRLTPAMMGELWPNFPADGATTLQHLATLYGTLGLDRLAAALPQMEATGASNGWALAGQHTASAKPMLVNDTHLGLNAPDIWYLARLSAPGLDLVGATAPGVPAVILGHNRSFAWGFTTTTVDQFDLFVERLDPADANRYLTPDGPREFARRGATIKVKGAPDQGLTVRATRHGPVLSELTPAIAAVAPSGHVAALAGPALLGPNRTVEAMFAVNRAHDLGEFTAALADWQAPMQNIFYVDVAGNIGFFVPGRVPRRKTGDGFLPQPGWTGEADWIGVVPPAELPRALNPPSGRIVNANNRVVPDDYKYFISRDWDSPYRAARIGERLAPLARADAAAMETILADPVSRFARAALPGMLRVPPADSRSRRALQLLAAWDGAMRRERPEPLIFSAWTRQLTRDLLAEVLGKDGDQVLREAPRLILAALDGSSAFCKAEAKRCGEAASRALARALADLARIHGDNIARWRWGNAHFAPFRHPVFGRVPLLRDVVGFRVATDGDFFTVNRGAGRIVDAAYPFAHVHGATYRAIYDLADLDASRFIVAPGQSGHPLSRHWGDLAQPWANGRHITIAGTQKQLRRSGSVLTLAP
jgi:penicillin amidase